MYSIDFGPHGRHILFLNFLLHLHFVPPHDFYSHSLAFLFSFLFSLLSFFSSILCIWRLFHSVLGVIRPHPCLTNDLSHTFITGLGFFHTLDLPVHMSYPWRFCSKHLFDS